MFASDKTGSQSHQITNGLEPCVIKDLKCPVDRIMKHIRGSGVSHPPTLTQLPDNWERNWVSSNQNEQSIQPKFFTNLTLAEIEKISSNYLLHGKFTEYLRLLKSISQKNFTRFPILGLYKATAMLFSEYPKQQIEEVIGKVERDTRHNKLQGEIIAIHALIQSYTGDPELGIQLSKKALSLIAPQNTFFRNLIERNLGIAFTIKSDLRNANIWLEKLLMSSLKLEDWGGVLAAYNYLTFVRKIQGRLREAGVIYKKALDFIESHQLEMTPHGIKIIAGYAHLLLQWHRIDEAKIYCKRAIQYAKQTDILYAYTAYQHLSEAFVQENDIHNALAAIQELRQISLGRDDLYHEIHVRHTQAVEARIQLEAGRTEHAYAWLVSSGFDQISQGTIAARYGYELGYILPIATRVYLDKGKVDFAILILNTTIPKFLHQDANSFLIRALVALSVAYHIKGQPQQAESSLLKAMALGAPENNLGDFIIMGHHLMPLLYKMKKEHLDTDFLKELLTILSNGKSMNQAYESRLNDIDSLSKREMDVLELIAKGLTNREIGISLFLSANTIKSHSINIYRKLKVNNRTQAVEKAQLLGILPAKNPAYREDLISLLT